MKWKIWIVLIILSIISLSLGVSYSDSPSNLRDILNKAHLKRKGEFIVIHLKGSNFEMGYQQGVLLKKEIRNLFRDYLMDTLLKKHTKSPIKRFLLWNYFKLKSRQYQKYIPEELKEEILGIAKGSGLSYTTILTMHTFLDTMSLVRKKSKGCTNLVFLPEITEENKLYHARNLGFSPKETLDKNRVLFFFEPEKGIPFVSVGWPGMCGILSAMNMDGISISETGVGTAELKKKGTPIMFLLREIIQYADSVDFAVKKIISSERICGYTITVSEDNKKAVVFEVTGKRYNILFPEKGYLVSVNHYLSKDLFESMKPVYPGVKLEETTSYKRLKKFQDFIKSKDKFSLNDIQNLLRTPPLSTDNLLQSIVFIPEERGFHIYSEQEKQWLEFSLKDEFRNYKVAAQLTEPINFINKKRISPQLESKSDTQYYTKFIYSYLPEKENRLPDRRIRIYLFLPKARTQQYPLLIFLPHSQGVTGYIEENLAKFLSKEGFAFLTFETGFQAYHRTYREFKKKKTKLELALIYLDLVKEFIWEAGNILDWVKENESIDKDRICIGGLSLGSIASELVLELRDDINCGLFLLGGADLETLFLKSKAFKNVTKEILKNKEAAREFLKDLRTTDPLNLAYKLKDKKILMINALFDRYVPRECALRFWRATGYPEKKWLISGHLSSIFHLGFVENEVLAFLRENLKKEKRPEKIRELKISAPAGEKVHLRYEHKKFKVIFSGKYTSYEKRLKLGFEEREIFDTPLFFGLDFNGRWESDTRYDLKGKLMPDIYLGFWATRLTKVKLGFSSYKYAIYDLSDNAPLEFKRYAGRPQTNFLSLDILRETTDDKLYPTKGTAFNLNYNLSGDFLDSDSDFYRIEADYRHYYDLEKGKVLVARTKWGYESEYGNSDDVPFFEKFYLGGSGTVRGYKGRRIGPLDTDLLPLGGKFYEVINLELRFPIYNNWYGALFFDEGCLVNKPSNFGLSKIKLGTGFGLRYKTPWGFGRLDFGFKIGPDKDKSRSRLHVTFGMPF